MRPRKTSQSLSLWSLILLMSFFAASPFLCMIITAFKDSADLYRKTSNPFIFNVPPTLEHVQLLFFDTPYITFIINSAFVGVMVVLLTLLLAVPGAYALARITGSWGERAGMLIFLVYLVPPSLLFIPMYRIVVGLGAKELWLNEFNASPRRDPVTPLAAPFNISLEQQADFVVQASALALAAGVDRLAVYKLFDNDFIAGQTEAWGLVRHDGSLRPAFYAYQQVINQFQYAGNVRRYSINEASLVTLQNSNRTLYVLWNDTFEAGQFLVYLNSSQEVRVSDAVGNQWQVSPETIDEGNVLVLDAPAAERIDADWVVVGGAVRIISLSGNMRIVAFRTAQGSVIRLNG